MDLIVLFLREDILPADKLEADKVRRKVPRFRLSEDQKLYKRFFPGHIYYAFILRHQSYSLRSYMKGFVEVTQEEDFYFTELSLKAIGGRICKRKHKNM